MRTIILTFILGSTLGILGCTQNHESIEDDKELVVEDDADDSKEEKTEEKEEKHMDDPAGLLGDLIF